MLHGFVQAGGGSTRFGTDKALVEFQGKTLLARTVDLVASVCGEARIVAPPGKYLDATFSMVADKWPGQGPLGGILTALEFSNEKFRDADGKSAFALIVSCDMPFLMREWLAYLCERAVKSEAQVVVPESENGLEPLCACWRTDARPVVEEQFKRGVRKVTAVFEHLKTEVLDEADWKRFDTDGRLFWNMNTLADYEEARRVIEERAGS